jgi:hypothetical protein
MTEEKLEGVSRLLIEQAQGRAPRNHGYLRDLSGGAMKKASPDEPPGTHEVRFGGHPMKPSFGQRKYD